MTDPKNNEGRVTVTVKYALGHSITDTYEQTPLHCPRCGAAAVWADTGPGDYYHGPQHVCVACGGAFGVHLYDDSHGETVKAQTVEQIRAALAKMRP